MAQPFTTEQRDVIRQRLFESACRHALDTGVRKTSLDALTADAGISKSSFYKFYDSKEELFLSVAALWEREVLGRGLRALENSAGASNKSRAATFVCAVFEGIHSMGIARFLREDLPYLNEFVPTDKAREHYMDSADSIFAQLRGAKISFTAPDETVLSVIRLLYLSILNISDLGASFFPALRELVASACDRLVA